MSTSTFTFSSTSSSSDPLGDPREFHTNWEERLWSDDKDNNDGLEDVLGSWTSMEDPEWIHDNPILLNDPFTMDLTEIAVAPELLLPESPDQTTTTTTTNPETETETETSRGHQKIHSEPGRKRKVGRPLKTEARTVTDLPKGRVSGQTLREARYRH